MIWRNQTDTVTWLAVSVSLPTLLGYQRASAFVNATKLASQPMFSSDEEYKISNVLSNTFFIDIDHVSIAIHIVIVLSPSPSRKSKPHIILKWSDTYSHLCWEYSASPIPFLIKNSFYVHKKNNKTDFKKVQHFLK